MSTSSVEGVRAALDETEPVVERLRPNARPGDSPATLGEALAYACDLASTRQRPAESE